jgi:hypothetical protein
MNEDQKAQWLQDVAELGESAHTLWEYCYAKDVKNGKYWKAMTNNNRSERNREFRRNSNANAGS